ncbi:MAG: hypothetical protein JWL63_2752 [Rhodocyclales bacterium]|nr:hypothetical protein [Rhodocyclales bacterium]
MLRSSHKVVTVRLGAGGYAVSPGSLHGGAWQRWPADAAIDSLQARLSTLALPAAHGSSLLDVVVDIGLMRMQVIRFPAGVRKPLERAVYLKAAFRNVFGRDANDWHIIAEPTYVNEPVPAVAIDKDLMQAIVALGDRHELTLRSLRPSFVDCFNATRCKLSAHMGAFALIENGRICLGLWRHRGWVALSTQAFAEEAHDSGEALAALCAQMLARTDPPMPVGTLYIAGANKPFAVTLTEGWVVQWLEPEPASATDTTNTMNATRATASKSKAA